MSPEPVDLTTPQPPVSRERLADPARPPRTLGFPDLLDRLAASATTRAGDTQDAGDRQELERVARLARELAEALSAVGVGREPGGPRPA